MNKNKLLFVFAIFCFILLFFSIYIGYTCTDSYANDFEKDYVGSEILDDKNRSQQCIHDDFYRSFLDYQNNRNVLINPKVIECNDTIKDISILDGVQINLSLLKLLPVILDDRPEQILVRKSYIVSYNRDWRIPNWVAWQLTAEHADGDAPRRNSFREDMDVPLPRATPADYKGSGWSRGHMCPSGDNKWDLDANHDTFLMTNICPQDANLNSGLWNSIEMDCRKWAKKYRDIFIVCGPLPPRKPFETIGENKIVVPKAFFKIVLCLNDTPKAFGFIVKNRSGEKKTDLYYNNVREVERLTNMDFLPLLPDSIEDKIEMHADINEW